MAVAVSGVAHQWRVTYGKNGVASAIMAKAAKTATSAAASIIERREETARGDDFSRTHDDGTSR